MHRRRALVALVPLLVACATASSGLGLAQAPPARQLGEGLTSKTARPHTWSATATGGRTFMGTWTYALDPATGAASGIWTLIDTSGRTLAQGGWSAAKSPTGWSGGWRANTSGSSAEYAGTWSTSTPFRTDAPFAELFQAALQAVVSGTWRAGAQNGAWSIRAFE